ncbi:UspA domain protein [Hymenobacter roseosalivarius DSM 11622]|uniref:UspA domain protein n=1 Tax=Hymenobacter roseosalivarius DSM 11622 TaxID=645990 RepID=A0A1W1VYD9_9BACT|nr:universal stress protein [Hymenobacter roseosalivarius]SMB98402.1 UspA domain protein [Hymenobacter roseosalivarius DSM 11622]
MQNILVPTDFSPEAHNAFEVAVQLAHRTHGQITLLHVVEAAGGTSMVTTGGVSSGASRHGVFMVQLLQRTKQRMRQLIAEMIRTAPDVTVHDRVVTGDVDEAILEVIREQNIDLVVMGAHIHAPAFLHLFDLDSHAERLVRLSPCPVLTVKLPAPHFEVRSIVFASDFSHEADRAVRSLRQVCAAFPEATLHLLDVVTRAEDYSSAIDRIYAFADRHHLLNYEPDVVNAPQVSVGVPRYAEQSHADLVVMLSHGRTGLWHFLHGGSTAESVAVQAKAPVLTFHPETY